MSVEFIFRIIGMFVLGIGGSWFGVYFSNLVGEPPLTRAVAFGMVGCIAGLLISVTVMHPFMMWDPLMKGFAAAVMGGMTSLPGAVFGAYIVGIVEHLFGGYVSIEFKSVVAFVVIVLVLCVKPSGLFARHYVKKV